MPKPDYSKDIFKQLQELMIKCDNLSHEVKTIEKKTEKKFKKQIKEMKQQYEEKIEILENKVKKLEKENQKLRDDNDRLKKIVNNNSDNSSKPPSSDIKKNIPNNREKSQQKIGGQKGHKGAGLRKKDIENKIANKEIEHEVINVGIPKGEFVSKYIIDVEIRTVAKEYRFYKDENGKYNIPKEFQTDVQYGPELKTMCTALNVDGVVAVNRLTKLVSHISHGKINLSNGTIINFEKELNKKVSGVVETIKNELLNSEMMYTDGTSSRCNNKNICIRNYSTENYTYLAATMSKSKKCIEETGILPKYTGNLVHDHETVIYNYGNKHIECNVHVSRYLKGCFENTGHKWALNMRCFLCTLNEHRKRIKQQGAKEFSKEQLERYLNRCDEIIQEGYTENKKIKQKFLRQEEQKLLNRLKKYKENHTMFLCDFNVPFDNNLSEREIRHVKTKQKISGYFNNLETCTLYCNIKSVIITLKKQCKDFYDEFYKLYKNNPVLVS